MKKRIISALLVGTAVFGAVVGLAASLTVTSTEVGSGTAVVASCDPDSVSTAYSFNTSGDISGVTVSAIDDGDLLTSGACDGQTVRVELLAGGAVIAGATGTGTVAADANIADDSVLVTLGTAAPAANVTGVRVTITG